MENFNEPKTKRGEKTLRKICSAAEKLFSTQGFHNTSITEIASEADIAPGTIYIYFNDKKTIFKYLIEDLGHNLRKKISIATEDCSNRYEIEKTGFKVFFYFVNTHRGLYKIIWEAQFVDYELFKNYYDEFAKRYIKAIKEAQKNGEMKNINPEVLAYSFIGITNFIGLKWFIFEDKKLDSDEFESVMKFIKEGAFK